MFEVLRVWKSICKTNAVIFNNLLIYLIISVNNFELRRCRFHFIDRENIVTGSDIGSQNFISAFGGIKTHPPISLVNEGRFEVVVGPVVFWQIYIVSSHLQRVYVHCTCMYILQEIFFLTLYDPRSDSLQMTAYYIDLSKHNRTNNNFKPTFIH
jgi:hypothetical protein